MQKKTSGPGRRKERTMAQERLDKLIASLGAYSRREVKALVKEGRVLVDGRPARSADEKADPAAVTLDG